MTQPAPGPWLGPRPLLLASASATRRRLIQAAGLPVEAHDPRVDERALRSGFPADLPPEEVASRLAKAKALTVSEREPERLVVGADQVLELEGGLVHKPADVEEARAQLAWLSGRSHRLVSAGAVVLGARLASSFVAVAVMTMRPLGPAEISGYLALAGDAAVRSVGCYEAEGLGIHLFERIEGEHSTVLGLPMIPLLRELRRMGCLAF